MLGEGVSAVQLCLRSGSTYYTKDYSSPTEVKPAIERDEALTVFWFATYGKRFQETLLIDLDEVAYLITEREIP